MKIPLSITLFVLCISPSSEAANRFVMLGYPSITREWTGVDYQKAAEIVVQGNAYMPKRDGADGNAILDRIVNVSNFSFARNRTLPIDVRLSDMLNLFQGINTLTVEYGSAANRGANLHRELAELLTFTIQATVVLLELVDEFLPTVPMDEKHEVRMQGLKSMKMGVETTISGLEISLGERSFYTDSDLSLMLRCMKETLPRLKLSFSDDFRVELRKRLQKRLTEFRSDSDAALLKAMIEELAQPTSDG
jgi:hypothetical protein